MENPAVRVITGLLFAPWFAVIVACSHHHYYEGVEQRLGTNDRVSVQHHLAAYFPSGLSLNFPGYLIGLEDGAPDTVSHEGELLFEDLPAAGSGVQRIGATMKNEFLPFVSLIHRYSGAPYGEGNCALHSLYQNSHQNLMPFCPGVDATAQRPLRDARDAYRRSWEAMALLKEELQREVASGRYSHLIVAMMGLDTSQEESLRNFRSIAWSIRQSGGEQFRPLFIGVSWPSFFDNRWFDPVWDLLSYPSKADEADRLGLSWLGVLIHELIIPLDKAIPTTIIAHSFGARALSMASCVGPIIRNGIQSRAWSDGQVGELIGLGAAFSLERMNDVYIPFLEDINYPQRCGKVGRLILTASDKDQAVKMALWANLAGNFYHYERYCGSALPYTVHCIRAGSDGAIAIPDGPPPKLLYIDATELIQYQVPNTQGGAHSDIFRPEVGRMLWTLLQHQS